MSHSNQNSSINPRLFRCQRMLNDEVMKFSPAYPIEYNAKKCFGLNSYFLTIRHELHSLNQLTLEERREKMLKRLTEDFLQEEKELNEVDLGYINAHP